MIFWHVQTVLLRTATLARRCGTARNRKPDLASNATNRPSIKRKGKMKRVLPASLVFALTFVTPSSAAAVQTNTAPARLDRNQLLVYHGRHGQPQPVKSARDWQKRRAEIVLGMESVMGPLPGREKRCPLDVKIEEEVDCGSYVRRFITYSAEPNSRVPAYLLIPKAALQGRGKFPAVLCLHQTHALGQKVVVGLGKSPHDEYGVELVERGYVCLAPPYPL